MSGILVVPIYGAADEVLELPKDQLPDDPNEIMQILANELTPLKLWLELAVSYYQQQRIDQFTVVMETSTGDEGPFYQDYYKDDKDGRIALLNCLAAFNTTVAARSKNKQIKDQHLARAVELYQQADKIDPNMALTYVGKGLVHMAKMSLSKTKNKMKTADEWNEHLSQAAVNFENACQCDAGCIPAILGKAAVQFNRRQYADALKSYKRVLQLNPAAPPEVRLGLANCLAQLKYTEKAAQAFRRVLELAPDNVEALSGLAILEMNSEPDEKLSDEEKRAFMEKQIETALKMLERAYNSTHNQGDQNAVVLNHLANHFVIKGDLEKAFRLATKAFNNTEVRKMRAESTYHIARTHHIKSEYENAHKYYEYATHYAPDYLLPQFGLAQTNVHLNKLSEAMACLDKLLRAFPNSYEVRKLMGCVAHRNGDTSKAILHLTFIVENYPEDRIDEEVWVELGTLYELRDPHRALSMYSKARDALKRRNAKVPGELLNNIAALYHKRGFDAQAKIFYLKALKQMGVKPPSEEGELVDTDVPENQAAYRGSAISIMYNLARLHEQMHDMTYAERLYRSILKERPNYTDAYMRLGAMAEARGNNRTASIWYKEVMTVSPHNADAYTALAKLHVGEKNLAAAQKKLEKILHKNDKDAYASIMLGNIYLNNARYEKHKDKDRDSESKDKYQMLLSRALDRYTHVLHKQHNNVFAANGAAAVLFQTGRVREAKQMFSQIREAAPDVADVWVNLAHAYLVQGEYVGAIKLYEATLHKFFKGTDVELLRCMAHAEFVHASAISKDKKNVRDPMSIIRKQRDMLQRSRRMLQKAMHLNPLDYSLQFNMAVVLKKHAEIIIEGVRDSHNRYMEAHKDQKAFVPEIQIDDLEQVKNDLVVMRRIAGRLAKIDNEKEFPVRDRQIAETEYEAYGNEMAKILPKYFEAVDDHHREFHRHKNQILEEEKDADRRKEEERRQKMEEDLEIRRAREEKAAELERLKEELTAREDFLAKKEKTSKGNKSKVDAMGDDDFIDDEAARNNLDKNKGKAQMQKMQEEEQELIRCMEIFLAPSDGEEEDDDNNNAQHEAAKQFLDSEDEEAGEVGVEVGVGDEVTSPEKGKKRSRLQREADSDEEEAAADGGGGDAVDADDEMEATASPAKSKRRKIDDDDDDEAEPGESKEAAEKSEETADQEMA